MEIPVNNSGIRMRNKMGKKDNKKEKTEKQEKGKKQDSGLAQQMEDVGHGATYSDGHPHDVVQYLEAKLILKPDRFTSVESFRDFGKLMQRTAKKAGVGFIADPETGLRPGIREITFGDTPDFRLYNNAFILRRRIS